MRLPSFFLEKEMQADSTPPNEHAFLHALPDFFIPGFGGVSVKNDQVSLLRSGGISVTEGLGQTLSKGIFQAAVADFELNYNLLLKIRTKFNVQVGTTAPESVFPYNASATVYDALQKCLKQELGTCFFVFKALNPMR